MRTAEVQADITDPEGILGVLRSIQEELKELEVRGQKIKELNACRAEKVDKCTNLSDQVSEQLTDLLCHAETMETVIHENSMALCSSDRDIDQLLSVQERLESMKDGEVEEVTDSDLDNEQRLIGFVADELSSKIEELSKFRHRLTDANDAYKYEWDQFRNEIRQYNTRTLSLEDTADHLQELHLARFAGEETGTDDDSELLFRLVEHHINQITHRKLQRELSELQIKQKYLDEEIGTLIAQKQSLWGRYLDIEKRMNCHTADTLEDNHNIVKPTAAFSNLLDVIDGKFHPSMTHDLEQTEEEEKHGLYLHKCITDINVKLNFSDEESDSDADGDKAENVGIAKIPEFRNHSTGSGGNNDDDDQTDDEKASMPVVRNKIFDHLEEVPAEITKLRMRQNAGRRASLSHRNKPITNNTIIVSDSFKSFMPSGILKKRRASHF